MAFYGFRGDADNCYWTPYSTTYNYDTQIQAPDDCGEYGNKDYSFTSPPELNYSVYTYSEPKIVQYDPYHYHCSDDYVNYSNPKFLQYEPPVSERGFHLPSETNFSISYSVSQQFNEPEFEEYDPTPYGGGYDIAATYGKPLPPSDLTCYPRSLPQSDGIPLENFSYNSVPLPYGKGEEDDLPKKPPNGNKPVDKKPDREGPVDDAVGADVVESADAVLSDDDTVESADDDSDQKGFENGTRGDYGYEFERRLDQMPYGSGLESMDLCESIFGYWPCLAKMEEQERRAKCLEACDQDGRMDPWKTAADYLFGTPAVYGYGNYYHLQQQGYQNSWQQ